MRRFGIVAVGVCILVAGFTSQFTLLAAPPPKGPTVGDVYVLNAGVGTNQPLCNQNDTGNCPAPLLVASLSLPAGSYTIAAKLIFNRWHSTITTQSYCYLYAGATLIDGIAAATSSEVEFVPGSLQGAQMLSAPDTASIRCYDNNGLTSVGNWQLMATKVGTINGQNVP
jgi:hypothetical protein